MWNIIYYVMLAVILLVSIGLHEYAHALISHKLGDPTPKMQDRLSPNPIKHLDPIGFFMIFLIHFGWGKPVQVNPAYYKKPLQGELLVALAWPATNILLAIVGIVVMSIYARIVGVTGNELKAILGILFSGGLAGDIMIFFWWLFAMINISLAIFNMIPIPPLDGFRLVKMFAPNAARFMQRHAMYFAIFFLLLVLGPGSAVGSVISTVAHFVFDKIFWLLGAVIFY